MQKKAKSWCLETAPMVKECMYRPLFRAVSHNRGILNYHIVEIKTKALFKDQELSLISLNFGHACDKSKFDIIFSYRTPARLYDWSFYILVTAPEMAKPWICSSFIYSAINISTCIELFNINENYQVLPCLHGLSCILWKVIWSWAWCFKDAMKWLFYGDVLFWLNNMPFSLLPGGGGGGEPWISFSPSSLNTFCLVLQSYRADDTSTNI